MNQLSHPAKLSIIRLSEVKPVKCNSYGHISQVPIIEITEEIAKIYDNMDDIEFYKQVKRVDGIVQLIKTNKIKPNNKQLTEYFILCSGLIKYAKCKHMESLKDILTSFKQTIINLMIFNCA